MTIAENSPNLSLVGNVTTSDVDAGDGQLYSLLDNAGGRFSIDGGSGQYQHECRG